MEIAHSSATSWKSRKTVSDSVLDFNFNLSTSATINKSHTQKKPHSIILFLHFKGNIVTLIFLPGSTHLLPLITLHFYYVPKLAAASSFYPLWLQKTRLPYLCASLQKDWGSQIALMFKSLLFLSLDKIKEVRMLSPMESEIVQPFLHWGSSKLSRWHSHYEENESKDADGICFLDNWISIWYLEGGSIQNKWGVFFISSHNIITENETMLCNNG